MTRSRGWDFFYYYFFYNQKQTKNQNGNSYLKMRIGKYNINQVWLGKRGFAIGVVTGHWIRTLLYTLQTLQACMIRFQR